VTRLDLVVGPNGAGKSTFVRYTLSPTIPWSVFVNADEIARQRWPDAPEAHSYDAARIAADTRNALITAGRPLIAETVFSHPSKLELVRTAIAAGYDVHIHALLVPPDLSVARVARRVAAGGHDVPAGKIRERSARLWPLVADAILLASSATVYNGSHLDGPQPVALFAGGLPVGVPTWPAWAPPALTSRWPTTG
jgi:predicted ABC-type ATPase